MIARALRLRRDRSGHATILLAGGLSLLLATLALGIDAGTLYLEKRRVQGIADAAALAGAADPADARRGAAAVLALYDGNPASLGAVETGRYAADPALPLADRFAIDPSGNAIRIVVSSRAPLLFGRAFGLTAPVDVSARATAARIELAAFSIGARLVAVQGGLPNALLSGLAGTDLRLTALDYDSLAGGELDLLRFVAALRSRLALDGASFAEVLAADATWPQILAAAADTGPAGATLRALADRVPATRVRLSDLIDLGPLGQNLRPGEAPPIRVQLLAFVRGLLELGGARIVAADADLGIPGLAGMRLRLAIGERVASSPWLAVGAAGRVTVRTGQARLYVDTRLAAPAPLGLGAVRLPLYIELAPAEATLTAVSCAGGRDRASATLAVTPSVGTVAVADLDPAALGDFGRALTLRPAMIAGNALAGVTAFADLQLGRHARTVGFDAQDIALHRAKTVTTDLNNALIASLLDRMTLRASVAGFGVDAGTLTGAVAPILRAAGGPLDLALNRITGLLGVGTGQADVWIDGVRCGTPVLVG